MSISIVDDRPVQESGAGDEFGGVVRIADIRYAIRHSAHSPSLMERKRGNS